jgi:hypothetical protein
MLTDATPFPVNYFGHIFKHHKQLICLYVAWEPGFDGYEREKSFARAVLDALPQLVMVNGIKRNERRELEKKAREERKRKKKEEEEEKRRREEEEEREKERVREREREMEVQVMKQTNQDDDAKKKRREERQKKKEAHRIVMIELGLLDPDEEKKKEKKKREKKEKKEKKEKMEIEKNGNEIVVEENSGEAEEQIQEVALAQKSNPRRSHGKLLVTQGVVLLKSLGGVKRCVIMKGSSIIMSTDKNAQTKSDRQTLMSHTLPTNTVVSEDLVGIQQNNLDVTIINGVNRKQEDVQKELNEALLKSAMIQTGRYCRGVQEEISQIKAAKLSALDAEKPRKVSKKEKKLQRKLTIRERILQRNKRLSQRAGLLKKLMQYEIRESLSSGENSRPVIPISLELCQDPVGAMMRNADSINSFSKAESLALIKRVKEGKGLTLGSQLVKKSTRTKEEVNNLSLNYNSSRVNNPMPKFKICKKTRKLRVIGEKKTKVEKDAGKEGQEAGKQVDQSAGEDSVNLSSLRKNLFADASEVQDESDKKEDAATAVKKDGPKAEAASSSSKGNTVSEAGDKNVAVKKKSVAFKDTPEVKNVPAEKKNKKRRKDEDGGERAKKRARKEK